MIVLSKKSQTSWNKPVKNKKKNNNKNNPKRMPKSEFIKYEKFIYDIGHCQVCGKSHSFDKPHHSKYGKNGADKDDRSLVCICIDCHYQIHHGSYNNIILNRKQIEKIGEMNWSNYIIGCSNNSSSNICSRMCI